MVTCSGSTWVTLTVAGLAMGMIIFIIASGLTLIFGIMGVVNLAHGSFYMLGAYLAWWLSSQTGSLVLAIVLGAVLAASQFLAVGHRVRRDVINFFMIFDCLADFLENSR